MENKNLTAVEWLIKSHFGAIENCTPDFRNKIEQAKEMEKVQIINAVEWDYKSNCGEVYYNALYKKVDNGI
jgi:hypothetical protein